MDLESRILRLACERGLLTADQLDGLPTGGPPQDPAAAWGPRLQALLDRRLMDPDLLEALAWEAGHPDAGSPRAPETREPVGPVTWLTQAPWGEFEAVDIQPETLAWERYQDLEFLASGGSGRVYKAFDPRLSRPVALKILKQGDPGHAARLIREARAQARVDHPNICKVYEVGEVEGIPFISMQLVHGKSLDRAARDLGLRDQLAIVRDVAEGIHAAHHQGLVHLDLKPGNILLAYLEPGDIHPFVTDFGLVREEGEAGLGGNAWSGTPPFASPEQVRGEDGAVDRRSDIYALGVMLYVLATGRLPFDAEGGQAQARATLDADPVPLRKRNPELPEDLAHIVSTCMKKEREARYTTALALAEDLQRLLDGDRVLARPQTLAYRLSTWARRHRAVAAVLAASLAALAIVVGAGLRSAHRLRRQAILAEAFGREADLVVGQLQLASMAPPHDVRGIRAWARDRVEDLRAQRGREGSLGRASASAAIGKILAGLEDWKGAEAELQAAWDQGLQADEVAFLLAQAKLNLYLAGQREARRRHGDALPKQVSADLDRRFRATALALLDRVRMPGQEALVKGLSDDLSRRPQSAVAQFQAALQGAPWDYRAASLLGTCWEEIAQAREIAGDVPGAREAYEQSEAALQRSAEIARSLPMVYDDLVRLRLNRMGFERGHGGDADTWIRKAMEACDLGLQVDPDCSSVLLRRSELRYRIALAARDARKPWRDLAGEALADAQRASSLEPGNLACQLSLIRALVVEADEAIAQGEDPEPFLVRLREVLSRPQVAQDQGADALWEKSLAYYVEGQQRWSLGQDPRPAWDQCLANNVATCRLLAGQRWLWGNAFTCANLLAEVDLALGDPPQAHLDAARQAAGMAQAALGRDPIFLLEQAHTLRLGAVSALSAGQDPRSDLDRAEALLDQVLRPASPPAEALLERGRLHLLRAEWLRLRGKTPQAELSRARAAFQQAARLKPEDAEAQRDLLRVALHSPRGAPAEGAAEALQALLEHHPGSPWTRAFQGALLARRAESAPPPVRATYAQQALALLDPALAAGPALRREFEPFREACAQWVRAQPASGPGRP